MHVFSMDGGGFGGENFSPAQPGFLIATANICNGSEFRLVPPTKKPAAEWPPG
jgi:hypothetical protein